jgi:hypothetical protein
MAFGILLGGRELLVFLVRVPSFWPVVCLVIACYACVGSHFTDCDIMFG